MKKKTLMSKKISHFKQKAIISKDLGENRMNAIDKYSDLYNIEWIELYGMVLIEYLNRGKLVIRFIEKSAVYLCTKKVIKKDYSIGIAQIKISTAKRFCSKKEDRKIAKRLLNDKFNISISAQVIREYYLSPDNKNKILGLVKHYTTGNSNSKMNSTIFIYYKILKWVIKCERFNQSREKI